jgi:hypothetical protein
MHSERLEAGDWRLEAGGWRLEAGDWRLEEESNTAPTHERKQKPDA